MPATAENTSKATFRGSARASLNPRRIRSTATALWSCLVRDGAVALSCVVRGKTPRPPRTCSKATSDVVLAQRQRASYLCALVFEMDSLRLVTLIATIPEAVGRPTHPPQWAVVNTHPHREFLACEHLSRQAFSVYCPMVRKRIRHARRSQDVLRPLFPGYLFAQVDPNLHCWRPILSTFGVRTLVHFGEELGLVEDSLIQSFKAREIDGAITLASPIYRVGQRARIAGGAFEGTVVSILSVHEKDRVVVLLDLMCQAVRMKLDANRLSAL
ncbi:transcription elongation factor/antiterminator RfaH [Rhizobiales bacterium GAS191]|nr:transcription elongation factor/antiterminator RfaH [Rhizobiales bacterium GAS191]